MDDSAVSIRSQRLLQILKELPGSPSLDQLLQATVHAATELLESEECSILLYDSNERCLRFVAAPDDQLPTLKNLGIPLERSVAGWVYTHARPFKLNQADDDERIFRVVDREIDDHTRSLLALPLSYHGEVIGVIEAVNKRGDAHYTEEDVFFLETLAAQAASAIQSQHSLADAQRGLQKLLEMDQMKSDWIAILSHELRSTLGLIIGRSAIMLETAGEEQRGDLDAILRAAMYLKDIAGQLDHLEQFEKIVPRLQAGPVEALPLVKRVAAGFQDEAAARGITLVIDAPEDLTFTGDASKIAIALRNLLENALVYTNEGGWVRVRAESLPGFVKFAVIDRGIGIPEEEQARIFERFYRVRSSARRHKGPGLGLAITRDMVELHGGELWVESEDGQGSTFSFLIPQGTD